jgi:MEMO1 family protein
MNAPADLRPSSIAGQWYSDDPQDLAAAIDRYIAAASLPALDGEVVALVAPHAGHLYSGPVAGYAFQAVAGQHFDLVAVVAPMHRMHPRPLLTTAHAGYATPLGPVMVDGAAVRAVDTALNKQLGYGLSPVARDGEHALEIELPFLQRALSGDFGLLPIMMRDQDPRVAHVLGQALADTLSAQGGRTLLVASTDLSHFFPAEDAARMDLEVLRQVEALSPEGLYQAEAEGRGYACGLGPVAAVLWAALALGATRAQVLRYASSGDVTRDFSSVVGYGAAALLRPIQPA